MIFGEGEKHNDSNISMKWQGTLNIYLNFLQTFLSILSINNKIENRVCGGKYLLVIKLYVDWSQIQEF